MSLAALLSAVAPWVVEKLGPKVVDWIGRKVSDGEEDTTRTGSQKRNAVIATAMRLLNGDKAMEPEIRATIEMALSQIRGEGNLTGSDDTELRAHLATASDLCIAAGAGTAGRAVRAWLRKG